MILKTDKYSAFKKYVGVSKTFSLKFEKESLSLSKFSFYLVIISEF